MTTGARDAVKWNYLLKDSKRFYYNIQDTGYLEALRGLQNGIIPPLTDTKPSSFPNLREIMIELGQDAMERSLSEDWKLVKLVLSRISMDEIINTFYEKSLALGLLTDVQEPMQTFFESLMNYPDPAMKTLGQTGVDLIKRRDELSSSIQKRAAEVMPNTCRVLGWDLSCQLLAHFGSLERLAMCKSSSIQMAGAEKSLFISKTKRISGPKYGKIFKSPMIAGAKLHERGSKARKLSGILSLTFRADYAGRTMDQDEINKLMKKLEK